jgi:hypothetical protein
LKKKAIIYDLDKTIYPVSSISEILFVPLLQLLGENGIDPEELEGVKEGIMRKPFQVVAARHHFSEELTPKAIGLRNSFDYLLLIINYFITPCSYIAVSPGFQEILRRNNRRDAENIPQRHKGHKEILVQYNFS